jgi:GT2 family glycosyltransferase
MLPQAPLVTIAIVSRNRREELRNAVRSALEQEGLIEVLVVDDGSNDGTADMLCQEFPDVRVVRYEQSAGIAVRRNDATTAARGSVIVSIDDDAVFSSPRIVADTLKDLDHPRVGAVAIPYIDVGTGSEERQRAPEPTDRWITSVFRATAYAIRRDLLVELGGFEGVIFHQGEEWDLSLRMLDAGYLIRLGRADPIHHRASPQRSLRRMDVYGRRNELLICWIYLPLPWSLAYMLGYSVKGVIQGFKVGRPLAMAAGLAAGLKACVATRDRRRPISRRAFHVDRRARARAGIRLSEAEALLGPLGASPNGAGHPREPARRARELLRSARTEMLANLGRPIRCEVCGQVLFRGFPVIWRGKLKFLGAEAALVRADWDKMNRMTFRHVQSDRCHTPPLG